MIYRLRTISYAIPHTTSRGKLPSVVKSFEAVGFFDRLRAEVDRRGLTQEQVAEKVRTTGYPMKQPRVSEILKGSTTRLPLIEVEALARALGLSAGWLAFKEGKQFASGGEQGPRIEHPKATERPKRASDGR